MNGQNTKLSEIPLTPQEGFSLPGFLGNPGSDPASSAGLLEQVISTALGIMTIIAFIWFVIQFFIAAVQIIGSGGDKAALTSAKSKLSTSVIGLIVVVSAIFLVELIGIILGVDILNLVELINII